MTTLARLEHWRDTGAITADQYTALSALVRKTRFSVFIELNALLYLGVLSFVAGLGWIIRDYVAILGEAAILSALTLLLLACFYYCFSRVAPYSNDQVESPNVAFDYILYLGCLTFAVELGYLESQFHLLQTNWDFYLLFLSAMFFGLAYRFDNRLVLSLALSTLAGWLGLRLSQISIIWNESLRWSVVIYGLAAGGAGTWLYTRGVKKHFTATYLHIGANALFIALLSGVIDDGKASLYLLALLTLSALAIHQGLRFRRFAFVVYAIIYGYIGLSTKLLPAFDRNATLSLAYFVVSASIVIVSIVLLARRIEREG
jgi:hypothetical protein